MCPALGGCTVWLAMANAEIDAGGGKHARAQTRVSCLCVRVLYASNTNHARLTHGPSDQHRPIPSHYTQSAVALGRLFERDPQRAGRIVVSPYSMDFVGDGTVAFRTLKGKWQIRWEPLVRTCVGSRASISADSAWPVARGSNLKCGFGCC